MPLNLPDKLPAIELLKEENIFVIDTSRATQQDIRPLRIVVLNLMPLKITTETDLVRLLSNTPLQVEISFMKIKSHTSKNTPIEHMKTFYTDFDQKSLIGHVRTSHPPYIYVGLRKPDCIIITVCPNIRWRRRCSVFSSTGYYNLSILSSVVSTIASMCRIAVIQR